MQNRLKKLSYDWWLGAQSNHSDWYWTVSQRSLLEAFTDWMPQEKMVVSKLKCLRVSSSNSRGFHWSQRACTDWHHFICEIPANQSLATSGAEIMKSEGWKMEDYVGERECLENVDHFDGIERTVKNCFHFVKLQYNQGQAEEFCRKKWNASLADVTSLKKTKFLPLLKGNLLERYWVWQQKAVR